MCYHRGATEGKQLLHLTFRLVSLQTTSAPCTTSATPTLTSAFTYGSPIDVLMAASRKQADHGCFRRRCSLAVAASLHAQRAQYSHPGPNVALIMRLILGRVSWVIQSCTRIRGLGTGPDRPHRRQRIFFACLGSKYPFRAFDF